MSSATSGGGSDVAAAFHLQDDQFGADRLAERVGQNLAIRPPIPVVDGELLAPFGDRSGDSAGDPLMVAVKRLRLILAHPIPSDRIRSARGRRDALLNRLRRPFHDLVRFYVDAHAARLAEVVRDILAALEAIAADTRGRPASPTDTQIVADLRDEVRQLRREIGELRARLDRSGAEGVGNADHPAATGQS